MGAVDSDSKAKVRLSVGPLVGSSAGLLVGPSVGLSARSSVGHFKGVGL